MSCRFIYGLVVMQAALVTIGSAEERLRFEVTESVPALTAPEAENRAREWVNVSDVEDAEPTCVSVVVHDVQAFGGRSPIGPHWLVRFDGVTFRSTTGSVARIPVDVVIDGETGELLVAATRIACAAWPERSYPESDPENVIAGMGIVGAAIAREYDSDLSDVLGLVWDNLGPPGRMCQVVAWPRSFACKHGRDLRDGSFVPAGTELRCWLVEIGGMQDSRFKDLTGAVALFEDSTRSVVEVRLIP